ncbi:MAG: GNAT family N-acetyltransferase [Gammaproteobacteria bacterium]
MNELTQRAAQRADLPYILGLYAQPAMDDGRVLDEEHAGKIFERMQRYPDYVLYVGEMNGAIVASHALLIMDNLGHRGAPSAIVEDVVVAPQWQGRGIGRAMIAHALEIARERGCYKLVLSSNRRRLAAHRFYERLGFERHGYSFVMPLNEERSA